LNMPIQIIGEPTVRAADGLALSSRNGYLDEPQRNAAPAIYRTINSMAAAIQAGEVNFNKLVTAGLKSLKAAGFRPDYLEIREANSLKPASPDDLHVVILAAAFIGSTRLIDNIAVSREQTA
jgi:pantoate--beta-alanine ligase